MAPTPDADARRHEDALRDYRGSEDREEWTGWARADDVDGPTRSSHASSPGPLGGFALGDRRPTSESERTDAVGSPPGGALTPELRPRPPPPSQATSFTDHGGEARIFEGVFQGAGEGEGGRDGAVAESVARLNDELRRADAGQGSQSDREAKPSVDDGDARRNDEVRANSLCVEAPPEAEPEEAVPATAVAVSSASPEKRAPISPEETAPAAPAVAVSSDRVLQVEAEAEERTGEADTARAEARVEAEAEAKKQRQLELEEKQRAAAARRR